MRARSAGFTLIEVLVALAIVAIGMAAVLEAVTSSAGTVVYLRDKTLAEWVGLNQIATTRLALQPGQVPMTGNTNGDLDYAGRSWHWRQEVSETQVQGIVRIDVRVRPAEVKGTDESGWFATVSGIAGNALAPSQGTSPTWGTGNTPGQCPEGQQNCQQQQCQPGTPCNTPQQQPCAAGTVCNQTPPSGGIGPGTNVPPAPAPPPPPVGGLGGDDGGLGSGNDGLGSDSGNPPGSPNQ